MYCDMLLYRSDSIPGADLPCVIMRAQRESFDVIGRVGFDHDFGVSRYGMLAMLELVARTKALCDCGVCCIYGLMPIVRTAYDWLWKGCEV